MACVVGKDLVYALAVAPRCKRAPGNGVWFDSINALAYINMY